MIRFNYLYRDFSNYKNYGSVVLGNPNCISISEIDRLIREKLIEGEFFNAAKIGLPTLFFEISNCDDHELHEFLNIEIVHETECLWTIEELILRLSKDN
ncbi:hypothetical protein FUA48_02995 [Flavobacterium alkalisoli]|uniref:Uncharacterized protein n=1 Tax=Flavobacterium alkalisoli TaxID=2602769 RepID=A0A5B9FNJ2_9FLAO|nr:hypothetical protein [Flavobacterium alkalisoli]QEE48574.1 hypothetical protein FUA48_02995 [Flavobacterium alkalisoli]